MTSDTHRREYPDNVSEEEIGFAARAVWDEEHLDYHPEPMWRWKWRHGSLREIIGVILSADRRRVILESDMKKIKAVTVTYADGTKQTFEGDGSLRAHNSSQVNETTDASGKTKEIPEANYWVDVTLRTPDKIEEGVADETLPRIEDLDIPQHGTPKQIEEFVGPSTIQDAP